MDPEKKPVEVYAEKGETKLPEASPEELKALALAYAKYLAEHDIEPGEPTFTDEIQEEAAQEELTTAEAEEVTPAEPVEEKPAEKEPAEKQPKTAAAKKSAKLFAAAELSEKQIAKLT